MRQKKVWEKLNSDKAKVEYLEKRLELCEDVDAIIEQCHIEKRDLATTLDIIFKCLKQHLSPSAIFLYTQNEDLTPVNYCFGITPELFQARFGHLLQISKPTFYETPTISWYAQPLDMAGETIGAFGLGFTQGENKYGELIFDLMNGVAEELDGFFYGIQSSRMKHMTILEIQRCLKSKNLMQAIDMAINVISDSVPLQDIILMYIDEDFEGKQVAQYVVYRNYQKLFDSIDNPMPELEKILKEKKETVLPSNKDLENIIPVDASSETILLDGLMNETIVGKMIIRPPDDTGFSIASREIFQVFAEALRQRLVDFNKEKNTLRQFFSPETTRKLLKIPDYLKKHLAPHQTEIGIIYADISGFTKISEQILKEPAKIAEFVNRWSYGVVEIIFQEGGALDKLVGDCVIGLFGPPFEKTPPGQLVIQLLRAAVNIKKFTNNFLKSPENSAIYNHPSINDFGVAIGVNYCPAVVGLLGPNRDFTAFSSGMNNTARLQTLAKAGEILVSSSVKEIAEKFEPAHWSFEGPFSATVKNVKDPLVYFKLQR